MHTANQDPAPNSHPPRTAKTTVLPSPSGPSISTEDQADPPVMPMHVLQQPVVFGEVLFDCFADGSEVLGGAPFNVAWHLQGLGLNPIMISRVGADDNGQRVRQAMMRWDMSTAGVQVDTSHATGTVDVSLDGTQPTFDIKAEQAYDYIDQEAACAAVTNRPAALLYHGTLALRNDRSHQALQGLQHAFGLPIFMDLNLRAPWWTQALIQECVKAAVWLKLNEDEVARVAGEATKDNGTRSQMYRNLLPENNLAGIFITRGRDGADLLTPEGAHLSQKPDSITGVVDTVGAGDAFSAVVVMGLMRKWPLELILGRAVQFAAQICGIRGATTFDRTLYTRCLEAWRHDDDAI